MVHPHQERKEKTELRVKLNKEAKRFEGEEVSKPKVKKVVKKDMTELEKLESELADIEKKLSRMA